jgi:transcriptional regulator with XRE-family HTH domain
MEFWLMSEEQLSRLGKLIGERAKSRFKSNLEFASACDIDEKSIRRILNGKQNFSITIFSKICAVLGMKMSELLSEVDL